LEEGDDLYSTHAFIRDRTRSIRQDFTLQNYRRQEAIDCHERIARYHILCLHALCDNPNFSEQQEMEQLRKVLQSLMEFYKDTKMSSSPLSLPNEAEFRAYYALVFLRDFDVSQQLQTLPPDVFFSSPMMRSLRIRSWAQRSNDKYIQTNAEAAPNSFVRFFKEVRASTTYLEACVLETWFGNVRTSALKALRQALGIKNPQISQVPIAMLVEMLGFDDANQFVAFCDYLSLEIIGDEETGEPKAVWFRKATPWEGKFLLSVTILIQCRACDISSSILFVDRRSKARKSPVPVCLERASCWEAQHACSKSYTKIHGANDTITIVFSTAKDIVGSPYQAKSISSKSERHGHFQRANSNAIWSIWPSSTATPRTF
jgi:hypothetical protein